MPKHQRGIPGAADELKAFEATDMFLENRTTVMTSVTQQEALENYEKNQYATEEKEQDMPAKRKVNGQEIHPGTAYGKNQTTSCSLG